MMTVRIGKDEFELPESWNEVTLGQFVDIANINNDKYGELEKSIKILGVLSRTNKDDVWGQLDIDDFNTIQQEFAWLETQPIATERDEWIIDGVKYGIKKDFNKLNVGEMASIEMLIKDKKSDLQPIELTFGLLFREKNEDGSLKSFNPENMFKVIQYMKDHVMVTDLVGISNFFLLGGKTSITKNSKVSFQIQKTAKTNSPTKKKAKKK